MESGIQTTYHFLSESGGSVCGDPCGIITTEVSKCNCTVCMNMVREHVQECEVCADHFEDVMTEMKVVEVSH